MTMQIPRFAARVVLTLTVALGALTSAQGASQALRASASPLGKVEPRLLARVAGGERASFIILLADQANVSGAYDIQDQDARGWYVYQTLRAHAERTQAGLRLALEARGVPYRSFWAANALLAYGGLELVTSLAVRTDVRAIESNETLGWIDDTIPQFAEGEAATDVEWGVQNVNAPQAWALGFTGQQIVIGNEDTGMQWDHPALQPHYRGWDGSVATHDYNWHDSIHDSVNNPCGNDSPLPCDDSSHGTHTTGTTSGDDGHGNQIGVAPGAQWIGCRNMDRGVGTPQRYTECMEFFIAPTDLNGENPDPTLRPHIVNNSWVCPPGEGCAPETLRAEVENVEAAGIFFVAAAGNGGPSCESVNAPPATYAATFAVGAYDIGNNLASFSSRGPVTELIKPDISAPGVDVRSAVPGGGYASLSGTSMASPHVAGVVALVWSARSELQRQIQQTKDILRQTANPNVNAPGQTCGGLSSTDVPNNLFGYGAVDALKAINSP